MLNRVITLTAIVLLLAGCGGGGVTGITPNPGPGNSGGNDNPAPGSPTLGSDHVQGSDGMSLDVIRNASGTPVGVKVSWTRVDDAKATGYYIYRDTASLPGGDPAGQEAKRINSGNKINQFGSPGTISFDDIFNPPVGNTYFYRMTVVNDTSDESDMSNQLSITIAQQSITNFNPAIGGIGDTITINGTNFGTTQNSDKVFFTNKAGATTVEVTNYVSWNQTQIVVKVPYGASNGKIGVKVGATQVNSSADFDYKEPNINTVTPSEDWIQNQYIVLAGNDFGPAPSSGGSNTKVFFGATQALVADFDEAAWTTSQIKVKVPAAAVGKTVQIKVSVADNDSNLPNFIILPHIDSLNSTSGPTGSVVTITGSNFGSTQGTSTVSIGSVTAPITTWANGSIQITIPAAAVDGNIVVNRDDTKTSNGVGYDVTPTISSISPSRRVIGEDLTITGTGFGNTQGTSKVTFLGGTIDGAVYTSWSNTQIVVKVPTGATSGQVKVTISDASVGANVDTVTSTGSVKVVLAPPDLTGVGQV